MKSEDRKLLSDCADWTDASSLASKRGISLSSILGIVSRLISLGLLVEETIGGRIKARHRVEKQKRRSPPRRGPKRPSIRLSTKGEITDFLDEQYDPVTSVEIAWAIENALDWVREELAELASDGKVLEVGEDLWVTL